jgi:hypothetical protein
MSSATKTTVILIGCALLAVACSSRKAAVDSATKSQPPAPKPIVSLASSPGRVARVNAASRFVVVSYAVGSEPTIGQRLNVYRNGQKVGELKVTGPQNEGSTVADIVNGEIQLDDETRPD